MKAKLALDNRPASAGYIYLVTAVAALGGLLFGFDIAIINGAIVFLKSEFALSDAQMELAASSLLVGCVFGAGAAGALSDRLGRKRLLVASALIFAISAVAAAIPRNLAEFAIARFIGGIAIGVASMLSPLYIAEIAPARIRGRLVSMNQLAIVTGILLAYFTSWVLSGMGIVSWRWMFASAAIPSVFFLLALIVAPESPRWLVKERRESEALEVLTRVGGSAQASLEMREIKQTIETECGTFSELLSPRLRKPLIIAIVLAVLQQVTGVNTILFYGSVIFTQHVGQNSPSAALWANVIVGLVNLVFTIVSLFVIDRIGRKAVLLLASGGMGAALITVGALFRWSPDASSPILSLILLYVACFAVGMGPGVWVVMSELFPTSVRGRAMSVATIALWCACTLLTFTFLSLANALTVSGAFWLYALMCAVCFFFVLRQVPETKGKTLEEIERSWN